MWSSILEEYIHDIYPTVFAYKLVFLRSEVQTNYREWHTFIFHGQNGIEFVGEERWKDCMRTSTPLQNLILKVSIHETTSIILRHHETWEYKSLVSMIWTSLCNESLRSLPGSLRNKLINILTTRFLCIIHEQLEGIQSILKRFIISWF
jgi:hypothetical protein